jgi:oligoribonuclease
MVGPSVYADRVNDPSEPMVWCDIETTGLEKTDRLLEIAVLVTDADLHALGAPVSIVLPATDARLEAMTDIVKTMHRSSGLWAECRVASGTVGEAQDRIMEYVAEWVKPNGAPMCGSNIRFDRERLERWMPSFEDYCHYRIVDVSSVKELARRWNRPVYDSLPKTERAHRALPDLYDSIGELGHYRQHFLRTATPAA